MRANNETKRRKRPTRTPRDECAPSPRSRRLRTPQCPSLATRRATGTPLRLTARSAPAPRRCAARGACESCAEEPSGALRRRGEPHDTPPSAQLRRVPTICDSQGGGRALQAQAAARERDAPFHRQRRQLAVPFPDPPPTHTLRACESGGTARLTRRTATQTRGRRPVMVGARPAPLRRARCRVFSNDSPPRMPRRPAGCRKCGATGARSRQEEKL